MSNDTSRNLCELVEESIATLIDGGEVDARLLDHIADCDRCRDLRYEAARLVERMRDASSDYVHPTDFDARLLERLTAAAAVQPVAVTQPMDAASAAQPAQSTQPMPALRQPCAAQT